METSYCCVKIDTMYKRNAIHVFMLIVDTASIAYKTCPLVLLGLFNFNVTLAAGVTPCNDLPANAQNTHLDICTDETKLHFKSMCAAESLVYSSM